MVSILQLWMLLWQNVYSFVLIFLPIFFLKLTIDARDQGVPSRQSAVTVEITVLRDTGRLAFSAPNYNITIDENRAVSSFLLRAEASPGVSFIMCKHIYVYH